MNSTRQIAEALKAAQKARRKTHLKIAEETGLSPLGVSNLLHGRTAARLTTLIAVADSLGLEVVLLPKGMAASLPLGQDTEPPRPLSLVEKLLQDSRRSS